MASAFHGSLGGSLLLTICLSTCLSAFARTVTEDQETTSFPEVTIPQGTVRGVNMTTHRGRTVYGFIGIPYAQPPVGDLRFKAPLPPNAWNGTLDASHDSPMCVQMDDDEVVGEEDCLHLNVFTPKHPTNKSSTLLPVIFQIFGGAFQSGSNTIQEINPDYLLARDVILVVPNFRVGVLGFLSTGDEVSPGNHGLKDIVRALEWNRDNIRHFGGDPDRVTITGSSSGAMSITMLLMSNSTQGLIHQAIQEGGSGLEMVIHEPIEVLAKRAFKLGAHLGCPTNASTDLVDCLRGLKASQLVDTVSLFEVSELIQSITWHPTAEPEVEGAFLTETPNDIMASGEIRDIPCIRGNVRNDGLTAIAPFYTDDSKFEELLSKINQFLPHLLSYGNVIKNVPAYTSALRSYYLNNLNARKKLLLTNITQLVGDFTYVYPLYKELNQYVVRAKSPQYYFVFEYRGVFSLSYSYTGGSKKNIGVAHSDVLLYLFRDRGHQGGPSSYRFSKADWKIVDTMVELWTSFAINGTPNAKGRNRRNIWTPYSSSTKNYLRVGNEKRVTLDVKYGWSQPRMDFMAKLDATIE